MIKKLLLVLIVALALPVASQAQGQVTKIPFIANAVGAAATVAASGAHYVYDFCLLNNNAAVVWVEFFKTTTVTLGTTAPVSAYPIAASATLCFSGNIPSDPVGTAGFAMAAVTAFNGSTPGSVSGTVHYK